MKFRWDKKYLYWGVTAFVVIVASLALLWLFTSWDAIRGGIDFAFSVLSPVFYGIVIAYLLVPLCKLFERAFLTRLGQKLFRRSPRKAFAFSRGIGVMLSLVLALAFLGALLYLVLPQVFVSIEGMVSSAGEYITKIPKWLEKLSPNGGLETVWKDVYNGALDWMKNSLLPQMDSLIGGAFAGVFTVIRGVLNWVIGIVLAVYLMYSREKFLAQVKKVFYCVFPTAGVNRLMKNAALTHKMFGGFITAKIIDSIIVGVVCYLFMLIFNMPYAALIGVLIGVTNVIPVFGPFLGAIPSGLILLLVDPWKCLWFLVFIIVLQQVDGNVLGPKLMGTTTGLNSFWVMVALLLGGGFFGFVGMLCGVPVFAVLYTLVRTLMEGRLRKRALPTDTESYRDLTAIDETTHTPRYSVSEDTPHRKPSKRKHEEDGK